MAGKRIGLVIGNNYPHSNNELKFAVADASKMKTILENKDICGFDEVVYLQDETSNVASAAVERILKKADNDLVFIYYSGHGKKDFEDNLCLMFSDTEEETLFTNSLTFDFISKCIRYPSQKSVVIVLDCCYSGIAEIRDMGSDVMGSLKKHTGSGTVILTSTGLTGSPTAREDEKLGHGIFTNYLIEGLETGSADKNHDGYVSIDELYDYAFEKTKENSSQSPKREGRMEGTFLIGINPLKIKENEYELKKKKLFEEFGDKLPSNILGECQAILRKEYKNPSILEKYDKVILGYLKTLLEDNLSFEKHDDAIQNCIEAVNHKKEKQEQERKLKEEQERKLKEEQERKLKEEQERKLKEEQERKLKEEQERKLKEEQERKLKEEQERKLKEEQERKLKEEQERKLKEEQERKLKEEQERKLKEEQERKLKEEQERKLKEEQKRKLKEEQKRKLKEEQERKLKEEQKRKLKEEQKSNKSPSFVFPTGNNDEKENRELKEEQERKVNEEVDRKLKEELERIQKEEQERKRREEQERKLKQIQENERKRREEEQKRREKQKEEEERERKLIEEQEKKLKEEQEKKQREEQERKQREEQEKKQREDQEKKQREDQERKLIEEQERKRRDELKKQQYTVINLIVIPSPITLIIISLIFNIQTSSTAFVLLWLLSVIVSGYFIIRLILRLIKLIPIHTKN